MKRMRIWSVQFDRAQRGWICSLTFTYTNAKQFTDVTESVQAGARSWLWAFVRARRVASAHVAANCAKPGERESLGWAAAALLAICMLASGAFANDPPPVKDFGPPAVKAADNRPHPLVESSVYIGIDLGGGRSAGGTGTVIASEGGKSLILTNAHVVPSGAHPITVTYWCDRRPWISPATYLGGSAVSDFGSTIQVHGPDLALLSVNADLQPVEIADAIPAEGETVCLYGFGGGGSTVYPTLKTGRVLREDGYRTMTGDPIARTSIATVNGDSGSGIFNSKGQLVAVHWGGGAVRLDTVHAYTVQVLERKGLFQRLKNRLTARRISAALGKALNEPGKTFYSLIPAAPPPPAAKAAAPAAPAASNCPGGVCLPSRAGILGRRR